MNFIVNDNIITATDNIENGDGTKFMNLLSDLEQIHNNIVVKLHTEGGSVFDGNLMYNAIQNSTSTITIQIIGICASMGAIIALSIEEVYMVENGYIMIHAPSGEAFGTANDIESNVKILRSIEKNFIKKLINKTGQTEDSVKQWLNGDNWFDAEQSLQEGLIKGIIEPETSFKANFNPNNIGTKDALNRFSALFKNSNLNKNSNMNLRSKLISKYSLNANSSDTKIIEELEKSEELKENLVKLLELEESATDENIISKIKELLDVSQETEQEQEQEAMLLIQNAKKRGVVGTSQEKYLMNMFKSDFKGTRTYLDTLAISNAPNISSLISKGLSVSKNTKIKAKSEWNLDDYRKNAPQELVSNPTLYNRLKKEKFNK